MPDLQAIVSNPLEKFAVYYHNLFNYPLNCSEILRWTPKDIPEGHKDNYEVICKNGFCFMKGKEVLLYERSIKERLSKKKMTIAKNASKILSLIPTIKMIAISGSLAMKNADKNSDIDLFIITKNETLWTTRLFVYFLLKVFNFQIRKRGNKNQKDKLCLNMWMDECNLVWKTHRNIYTAHEIAQLIPLVNKDKTYEYFLSQNKWITKYWSNAVRISNYKFKNNNFSRGISVLEKIAFKLQYLHMKDKITREIITPTRAIFHPQDMTNTVLSKLSS